MSKKLRFAIIGAGRIGYVHAGSVFDNPNAELVYIVDPFTESAQKVAAAFGGEVASDPEAIITSGEIDAVIIGSPTPTHVPLLATAIKQDPHFKAVKARVEKGEIGKVEQVVITSRDPGPAPQAYIAISGGIFRDMTIHDFDIARYFVPNIVEVTATGTNSFCDYIKEENDFDNVSVVLKGADNEIVTIINSRHSAYGYDQRLEVFGDKGMLQIKNLTDTTVELFSKDASAAGEPYMDFFLERYAAAYRNELALFIKGISEGKNLGSTYDDGRAALILADAAHESARTGKSVKVSL